MDNEMIVVAFLQDTGHLLAAKLILDMNKCWVMRLKILRDLIPSLSTILKRS